MSHLSNSFSLSLVYWPTAHTQCHSQSWTGIHHTLSLTLNGTPHTFNITVTGGLTLTVTVTVPPQTFSASGLAGGVSHLQYDMFIAAGRVVCYYSALLQCVTTVCYYSLILKCVNTGCYYRVLLQCVTTVCYYSLILKCVTTGCYYISLLQQAGQYVTTGGCFLPCSSDRMSDNARAECRGSQGEGHWQPHSKL